jgi:hypothetical protein
MGRAAISKPLNGTLEVAGPGQFGFDELVRKALSFHNDPREVISDPDARYYNFVRLTERELLPGDDARIFEIRFEDWLPQNVAQ